MIIIKPPFRKKKNTTASVTVKSNIVKIKTVSTINFIGEIDLGTIAILLIACFFPPTFGDFFLFLFFSFPV